MESILEELYYGNIRPANRNVGRSEEYENIVKLIQQNESALSAGLTEEQKKLLEKLDDAVAEQSGMNEVSAFKVGFKLGLRLAIESFLNGGDSQLVCE